MPFGVLIANTLNRREITDRERSYSDEYIQMRTRHEVRHAMISVAAIVVIALFNWGPINFPVLLDVPITLAAVMVLAFSMWKFCGSLSAGK